MEVLKQIDSNDELKQKPLTTLRVARGVMILVVFLSTAFMFLIYFAPFAAVVLRLFSRHRSRQLSSFLFGLWLALWPYLFEKINGTKVVFSGDAVPSRDRRVLIISNHSTEVDWMYLWDIALRKGCLGYIKYILKSSLMKLPVFGWGFHVFEFIPVQRKREIDEPFLLETLSSFKDPRDHLWLALFPEGTDFTEEKSKRSQKYAAEAGLPVLANVLLPKTKGFCLCLEALQDSLDAVYDLTMAYKHRNPCFLDNVFGVAPAEVHIHIRRFPLIDIPKTEEERATWLVASFQQKDKILSDFKLDGHLPAQRREKELSTLNCIATFTVVIFLTIFFTYLTFFSSHWFKIYVALTCTYFPFATHFKFRPSLEQVSVGPNYRTDIKDR